MATKRNSSQKGARSKAPAARRSPRSLAHEPSRMAQEIIGITLCTVGVALLIALLTGERAVVPKAVAQGLKLGFGLAAYVVPFVSLLWGVSFFVPRFRVASVRVGIGLTVAFLALVAGLSLAAEPALRTETTSLVSHGGYVGFAFAWALGGALGSAIGYVVTIAVFIIGIVVATGVSVAELAASMRERAAVSSQPAADDRVVRGRVTGRGPRTVPLGDLDTDEAVDRVAEEAAVVRGARRRWRAPGGSDPESQRVTVPSTTVVAPRALEGFELPSSSLLKKSPASNASNRASDRELRATADVVESTLSTFDIPAKVANWIPGPTVTMFEVKIAKGVKVNRVTTLADDIALALAAPTIRILAPIPGKSLIGIEVPNDRRSAVTLADVLAGVHGTDASPLSLAIGKDVEGQSIVADLASMPHLLIAGATGTGKSVCINALLVSLLMRATPAEVRLILIDPKRIELSLYNGLPHLYVPVVTEPKQAASALAWSVSEMERRLRLLQGAGVRNIASYNSQVHNGKAPEGAQALPYLVIVIDELADLMMVAAREVEDSIVRIAQLARAAGIHLIVATQRPSTDIITGLIKTNITNRIAFSVSSSIDSRVILDTSGAEKLVGLGDMLFSTPAWSKPKRIQGAFVSEDEIEHVVAHLKTQAEPDYHEEILTIKVATGGGRSGSDDDDDPLLWEAADIIVTSGLGSTSMLQRRLKVGYARAGRIMDMLEAKDIVGPPDGSKPREVLIDVEDLESLRVFDAQDNDELLR